MKRGTRQKTKCVAHGSGDIKQLQANCASEEMISPRCTATRTQVSRSIKWSKVTGPGAATKTKKHAMTVGVAPPVRQRSKTDCCCRYRCHYCCYQRLSMDYVWDIGLRIQRWFFLLQFEMLCNNFWVAEFDDSEDDPVCRNCSLPLFA